MPLTIEQLKAEAMHLSPEERADLADWLWISATPRAEAEAAWDAEIASRIVEIDAGTAELIPSEMVMTEIEAKLRAAERK